MFLWCVLKTFDTELKVAMLTVFYPVYSYKRIIVTDKVQRMLW